MTTLQNNAAIILVPGHWLGAWAWDQVTEHLHQAGHHPIPLTLPGLDPNDPQRASRTLDEQAAALEEALREAGSAGRPVILVAHSGANAPVSILLDRHPELVSHMVWVDSGPIAPGSVFAPDLPAEVLELPLPPFEVLAEQASLEGLEPDVLDRFRDQAVPEPAPVLRQTIELSNDQRHTIPTTLVCCSLPGAQIMELAQAGHPMFSEIAHLQSPHLIDLPTGHWPMWSRPDELAKIITTVAPCDTTTN